MPSPIITATRGVAKRIQIFMQDSATAVVTGKTALSLTINLCKAGAVAFSVITPTVTEIGNGWYDLQLTASHLDTFGTATLYITGTSARCDLQLEVVPQGLVMAKGFCGASSTTSSIYIDGTGLNSDSISLVGATIVFTAGPNAGTRMMINGYTYNAGNPILSMPFLLATAPTTATAYEIHATIGTLDSNGIGTLTNSLPGYDANSANQMNSQLNLGECAVGSQDKIFVKIQPKGGYGNGSVASGLVIANTFAASIVKVSKNGAAAANAAGTWTEFNGTTHPGLYYYTPTAGEVDTAGPLRLFSDPVAVYPYTPYWSVTKAIVAPQATAAALSNVAGDANAAKNDTATLVSRLSALRAGYLDNLSAGAVALASALVTAQTDLTSLTGRLTAPRATALDNLDAAISTRATAAALASVATSATAAASSSASAASSSAANATAIAALPSTAANAAAVWTYTLDSSNPAGSKLAGQIMNLIAAACIANATGLSEDGTVTFRNIGNTRNAIVGTINEGARVVTTVDGTVG